MPPKTLRQEIVERAGRTLVQAFLAVLVGAGTGWVNPAVWQTAAIAAVAAAIAAGQTVLRERWSK